MNYGGNDEEAEDDPWTRNVCDGRKKYNNYPTCGRCYTAGTEAAAAAAGKPSATAAAPASEPEQQANPAATTDAAAAADASEEAPSDPAAPTGSREPEDVGNGVAPEPAPEKN